MNVPIKELEKLEEERIAIYEYLEANGVEDYVLMSLPTAQIWKVANTKDWEKV